MKKSKLKEKLRIALEEIEYLESEKEKALVEVAGLIKENAALRRQIDDLSDERKIKDYVAQVRQLHGIAICERNFARDRFKNLYRQLEEAEKAAFDLLDSIGRPVYQAMQAKGEEK